MIFGLIKGITDFAGTVIGTVLGVSFHIVAETLGITISMVDKAVEAGCKTQEEIKEFYKL